MPITFSESSSDEAAPAAQAHAVLKAGLAARGAAPKKNKAAAPAAHAGKSTSKLTSSKTVGAKRVGRERSRLNLLSDGSSDDADELDLSDDDESEKIAAALKQMAEQMVCAALPESLERRPAVSSHIARARLDGHPRERHVIGLPASLRPGSASAHAASPQRDSLIIGPCPIRVSAALEAQAEGRGAEAPAGEGVC